MKLATSKILLIEDATHEHLIVSATLHGVSELDIAPDLESARAKLQAERYSLILLDVDLPDGDGFNFCAELRKLPQHESTPVIFLTGKKETEDRIKGFTIGGDDYITKPFEPEELIARTISKIKRSQRARSTDILQVGGLQVDVVQQKAFLNKAGESTELFLTPIELKILSALLRANADVLTREDLVSAIWGKLHVSGHAADTHVSSLRKKIAPDYQIKSIFKKGFQLVLAQPGENASEKTC